jgi:hypothetical protein
MRESQALQKILRGYPGPRGKEAVKMERAQACGASQGSQTRLIGMMLFQVTNARGDSLVIVHAEMMARLGLVTHPLLAAI